MKEAGRRTTLRTPRARSSTSRAIPSTPPRASSSRTVTDAPARKGGGNVGDSGVHYAVRVLVDGRELALKEFLHDVIGGAVDGMVRVLRDVDEPRSIRVDVTKL